MIEHDGRITGYTTGVGWFTHTVGKTNDDLKALIGSADAYSGPVLPASDAEHRPLPWCLAHGLRLVTQMTLMTIGLYNEPQGAYLPGALY